MMVTQNAEKYNNLTKFIINKHRFLCVGKLRATLIIFRKKLFFKM